MCVCVCVWEDAQHPHKSWTHKRLMKICDAILATVISPFDHSCHLTYLGFLILPTITNAKPVAWHEIGYNQDCEPPDLVRFVAWDVSSAVYGQKCRASPHLPHEQWCSARRATRGLLSEKKTGRDHRSRNPRAAPLRSQIIYPQQSLHIHFPARSRRNDMRSTIRYPSSLASHRIASQNPLCTTANADDVEPCRKKSSGMLGSWPAPNGILDSTLTLSGCSIHGQEVR